MPDSKLVKDLGVQTDNMLMFRNSVITTNNVTGIIYIKVVLNIGIPNEKY